MNALHQIQQGFVLIFESFVFMCCNKYFINKVLFSLVLVDSFYAVSSCGS